MKNNMNNLGPSENQSQNINKTQLWTLIEKIKEQFENQNQMKIG